MSKSVYDTRFFIEHFYSNDREVIEKTNQEITSTRIRFVSVVTLHELYKITLGKEGRDVARFRVEIIKGHFKIINVDDKIAINGAELRHKYRIPMGDSLIAATSQSFKATCVSDDEHFKRIEEIKTRWI
ncbi:MAG: PIN domain-containing protein [Nitrososphaerales archaeon]